MITTQNIPNIGSPSDDPTCQLRGILYIPDPNVHPQPWNCVVGTCAGGFKQSASLNPLGQSFTDLANAGFLCLAHFVRLTDPIQTQTTSGRYPQQTNDLAIGIAAMRSNPFNLGYNVTGFVAALGGSGSAHHALYRAINGIPGENKADVAICMSPPTDFSDREPDAVQSKGFITSVTTYGNSTDLDVLLSESPITLDLANANPILHYNGDRELMPKSQWTRFVDAIVAAGANDYTPILNTGALGRKHSFDMWTMISVDAIMWLQSHLP